MSLIRLGILGVIATALAAQSAAAQVEIPDSAYRLRPTVPWTLDFAENSCAARRVFGVDGREVYLQMQQFAQGPAIQMVVASDDISRRLRSLETTFIPDARADDEHSGAMGLETERFGDGFVAQVTLMSSTQIDEMRQAIAEGADYTFDDEVRNQREREIEGLLIENGFRRPVYLETGAMHEIMEGMRGCLDNLIEHWGLDLATQQTLSRPVTPIDQEIWSQEISSRYPREQLRAGEQALLRIRLMVSDEGRATDCAIQSSMNRIEFNELACELLLENARFEPALDAEGIPTASYWLTSVIYFIR